MCREGRRIMKGARMMAFMFLLPVLFAGCTEKDSKESVELAIGAKTFTLEIADSPEEREKGLMFRENMPADHGMLFLFERDQLLGFWMKNTIIPLSIAYLDSKGTIIDIFKLVPGDETPVVSSRSVRYAIELNRGAFEAAGASVGTVIDLEPLHGFLEKER
jgi:uncharacterized membrane protein (UPF0127 family)